MASYNTRLQDLAARANVTIDDDYAVEFFGSEWSTWDSETDVLIMSTNNDDGDNPTATVVPPCR